jgi:hypothetical protein
MSRLLSLCLFFILAGMTAPALAGDFRQTEMPCYWCIRDGIYANTKLIAHLEANPDIDEVIKGPVILGARAEIHHLRRLLGPIDDISAVPSPCCYSRKPLYIR